MSFILPVALGIANLTCGVNGPRIDSPTSHLFADFNAGGTASLTLTSPEGIEKVLSDSAIVTHSSGSLQIATPRVQADFSLPENQNSCFVISSGWALKLKETSYASYEGELRMGFNIDQNPNAKGPCAIPMMSMPLPSKVRCAAAIH